MNTPGSRPLEFSMTSVKFKTVSKIVLKMNEKISEGDVDGSTMVKKKNFLMIVEKIMRKRK